MHAITSAAFAAIIASPLFGSASAARAAPAWDGLEELQQLCIPTRADRAAVKAAAIKRGYRPVPGAPDQLGIGGAPSAVTLLTGSTPVNDPDLGPVVADSCMIFAFPGRHEPQEVLAWLKLEHLDTAQGFTVPYVETPHGPEVFNPLDVQTRKRAFVAGTLRALKVEPLRPEGVRLIFLVMRPAAPAAGAGHPSPP